MTPSLNRVVSFLKTYRKYFISIFVLIIAVSTIKIIRYYITTPEADDLYEEYFKDSYKIHSIRVPKNLNFAGEKVPVSNPSVKEAIEKELIAATFWKSQSLLLHKRASRWFPVIEPILKKNEIPDDFKYIAIIESQLTNVVSPQGATGFWQIVESTANSYGLEISEDVDERYHVIKATEAACKYFKEAHKQFGNWILVAASYNRGIGGIQVQMDKQNVDNYFDLELNKETSKYIYRLLATKEILSRPKVYGYVIRKKDLYKPLYTKKIVIDSTIHDLSAFAIKQGINFAALKSFNPWLKTNKLNNPNKKKYTFDIPKGEVSIYDMRSLMETTSINKNTKDSTITPAPKPEDSLNTKGAGKSFIEQ